MISLDFLENVELFKDLDDDQLAAIQERSQIVEYKRGDRLFARGETSAHLWVLMEGEVDLQMDSNARGDMISFTSKRRIFGWSCFAPPYQYRLSGFCASRQCKAVKMEKESLIKLFEADPMLGYQVMNQLMQVVGTHFQQYQDEITKRRGQEIFSQW
jgi:CRP-like cAMP-binding protein